MQILFLFFFIFLTNNKNGEILNFLHTVEFFSAVPSLLRNCKIVVRHNSVAHKNFLFPPRTAPEKEIANIIKTPERESQQKAISIILLLSTTKRQRVVNDLDLETRYDNTRVRVVLVPCLLTIFHLIFRASLDRNKNITNSLTSIFNYISSEKRRRQKVVKCRKTRVKEEDRKYTVETL